MVDLHEEKGLFNRTIMFLLILALNKMMLVYYGEEMFITIKVAVLAKVFTFVVYSLLCLSVLYYIKEKAVKIEVRTMEN